MRNLTLLFAALAVTTVSGSSRAQAEKKLDDTGGTPKNLRKIGDLRPTFYWVALEKDDGSQKSVPLKNMSGDVIARVSPKFHKDIRLEGTGRLLDGRVINFDGRVPLAGGGQEIRWTFCGREAPYGYGLDRRILVPFRSLAVDPTVVPMDSKIYIPKAKGIPLPDGTIHDGYFQAVDIGDAIKSKRIDVFTSFGDQSAVFEKNGMSNMVPVEVFLVE